MGRDTSLLAPSRGLPLSLRRMAAEFESRWGYMAIAADKADAMRRALAFVGAVKNQNWEDANFLLQTMIDGNDKTNPVENFTKAMGVMATLLCNELNIDDDWVNKRIMAVNLLEFQPDD